jgi:RimJ/RimL family protein N-acetyltransferase
MAHLTLRTYSPAQFEAAYRESQRILEHGGSAPFVDVYCSASSRQEPIHIYLDGGMVGFASIQWFDYTGDLWKFYLHPDWRGKGIGRASAGLVIDHFFKKPGIDDVGLEISGDTNRFWDSVTRLYPGRAYCGLARCEFVAPGLKILDVKPWIADYKV